MQSDKQLFEEKKNYKIGIRLMKQNERKMRKS